MSSFMGNIEDQFFSAIIYCPGIVSTSALSESIIEDHLTTLTQMYSELCETGVRGSWTDESYEDQVRNRLMDEDGNLLVTGSEHEYWNNLADVTSAIQLYANEIEARFLDIMDRNHDTLVNVSENYKVMNVSVVRKRPDYWVLRIEGIPL